MTNFNYLENLEQIKNNIKEKFNISRCSLSEKENLQLVLYDIVSNEQMEEIAEFCKKELEKLNKLTYKKRKCKTVKDSLKSNNITTTFIFTEIGNNND